MIQDLPPVEDEGRFSHVLVYPLVVQRHKLVPFSADDNSVGWKKDIDQEDEGGKIKNNKEGLYVVAGW